MNELIKKHADNWNKDFEILQKELQHSSSDRSCVIVAAAYLDNLLEHLLRFFLSSSPKEKEEDNDLFFGYGPLSSFSSKILLSYRLGLISNYEYKALQVVRKIRNMFAHNISKESLLDFKEILLPIVPPRRLLPVKIIPLPASDNDKDLPLPEIPEVTTSSVRDIFEKTVSCLANLLSARLFFVIKEKRIIPSDYVSLIEIEDQRISMFQECLDETKHAMNSAIESINRCQKIIKGQSTKANGDSFEINRLKTEIEELESDLADVHEEYLDLDTLLSTLRFARRQIKKAFDKESLS